MAIEYLAGNRLRGTNAERPVSTGVTGGTETTTGSSTIRTFTSTGTLVVGATMTVQYLVVAGGGGGEQGGGGAGAVRTDTGFSVGAGSHTITVGAGGSGGNANGGDSSLIPATTSSQTSTNDARSLKSGSRNKLGQQFNTGHALVGEKPKSVTWFLYKSGSPPNNVTAYIKNSSGTIRETSSTTLVADSLTGNEQPKEFTFAGTTTLATGDMITVEYNSGDNSNAVNAKTNDASAVTNSVLREYTSSWSNISGQALKFMVDVGTQSIISNGGADGGGGSGDNGGGNGNASGGGGYINASGAIGGDYGNNGGASTTSLHAAGGGGAGAVGQDYTSGNSGNGGAGIQNPIVGSIIGQSSSGNYYIGGGGGGAGSGQNSSGGLGGGAGGADYGNSSSLSGQANTGGGSGGSYNTGSGTGGSGVVIIKYTTGDGESPVNVQDGAVYYETDTNKSYVLYDSTWSEL